MLSKKQEQFAVSIGTCESGTEGIWKYHDDYGLYEDKFFVMDKYRILELETPVKGLPVYTHGSLPLLCRRFMDELINKNMKRHELPDVAEIKEQIRSLRGRKYSVPVAVKFYENTPAVNADYLVKGMEALKAKYFFTEDGNLRSPIYLLKDDEPQEIVKLMILPVMSNYNDIGYWTIKTV